METGPILIVDDDLAVCEVVTLALHDAFQIKQAATGREALIILNREPVAAVVLDYRLPDCSGLDLLSDIWSLHPWMPVIMISGHGSEQICASAFRLGVRDYFPKPLDVLELAKSVQRILPQWLGPRRVPDSRKERGDQPPAWCGPSAPWPDARIQKAVEVIRQRYWDTICLGHVARDVGISSYRLSHRFKQVMGLSFREYLLMVRLEHAKELLATSHASITDVAQAVGFSDLPRFDKLFKRYTRLTPSSYRSRSSFREKLNSGKKLQAKKLLVVLKLLD